MTSIDRTFAFDAGRVSLDLMATLANRGSLAPVERLVDETAFGHWLVGAQLAATSPVVDADDLAAVRRLREAVAAIVEARLNDTVWSAAVHIVNEAAAQPAPPPRLQVERGRFERDDPAPTVAGALSVVAHDAIDLVTGASAPKLRMCDGEDCTGIFVDNSRGARRRWCSTKRCGNRARVAAHRARRSDPGPHG